MKIRPIIHDRKRVLVGGGVHALMPVEALRAVVQLCDRSPESFNERFTIAELVQLWAVARACDWDFDPHQWSEDQIEAALQEGEVPEFDD